MEPQAKLDLLFLAKGLLMEGRETLAKIPNSQMPLVLIDSALAALEKDIHATGRQFQFKESSGLSKVDVV